MCRVKCIRSCWCKSNLGLRPDLVRREEWWKVLKIKLIGHYRYYGISGNSQALRKFYVLTSRLVYKWLNRRSQKKSYTYERYCKCLRDTLPAPKIYHLTYANPRIEDACLRSRVREIFTHGSVRGVK